ncbi:MAG: class I peptide chain release factor [uncultured bacterium]|nr:MAG: class I peptide chain release factor [uncultured bacterium]
MLKINHKIMIPDTEINIEFITSPGPGGQNVNKLATAVLLRFDALHSPSLPEKMRERLLTMADNRLTKHGEIIIKAFRFRTQERNKQDALQRLKELLKRATVIPKIRKKTKPTKASIEKRLEKKKLQSKTKLLRRRTLANNE